MTTSNSAMGPRGSNRDAFTAKRRQAGTSLVEILVVIVIFLIGILAVVQIFPRGFRLLLVSRNNSMATALGRDEVERIKANPDRLPEEVLPIIYSAGIPQVDATLNPLALGPLGDQISQNGSLAKGGQPIAARWMLASGPNVARRIIGEGARVPAPRVVDDMYGGLLVLEHGPVDPGPVAANPSIIAYANDLTLNLGAPRESALVASTTVGAIKPDGTVVNFAAAYVDTPVSLAPFEYFAVDPATSHGVLYLPTARYPRVYRVRLTAYLGDGINSRRVEYPSLSVRVPAMANTDSHPLVEIRLASDPSAIDGYHQSAGFFDSLGLLGGYGLISIEPNSLRVAPQYQKVSKPTTTDDLAAWNNDPFRMIVMDPVIGSLLVSPAAREGVVTRPGGASEPLIAKVDYDVLDWRVLREDFRVTGNEASFALALQSLKVGTQNGPDGLVNGGIFSGPSSIDPAPVAAGDPNYPRDNVMVVDMTTGFLVQEYRTGATGPDGRVLADVPTTFAGYSPENILVNVDKSRGVVTLRDAEPSQEGLTVRLISPTGVIAANAANRTFRVLYRARNEWSVQLIKGAAQYNAVNSFPVGHGNYLVGTGADGTSASYVYFPASDIGRKVTIDRMVYQQGANSGVLEGQDFLIEAPRAGDTTSLGHVDLQKAVGVGAVLTQFGPGGRPIVPVQGVKGASVMVRVLWNPDAFSLTGNADTNLRRVDEWGRSWRRSVTETYLRAEETR